VCGFACDSPAARRRPTRETDAQRPSARRAHTDRHTHTALDGDALSREIFLYVELDFVCPKKDAQGTVASSAHLRSAGPPLRPRARINRRPFRSAFASAGRAHTSCAAAALDARHQCTEARQADAVRAPHRARLHRPRAAPHGPLGKHMPCSQRARRNAALPERPRRARIPPTACSCDVPMVASVFVRIPVQGGEGCSMATRARTAHRSGNREASARTRCARMACRVQWRASVSWR
jgi:hypothetical protein